MEKERCIAVVLAAGQGKRMGTRTHKQYLLLAGYPVLYYSMRTFQDSGVIDDMILVTGAGEEEYCRTKIVEKYGFTKVRKIVAGGEERYHSVWNALQEIEENGFIFIHDGARPFIDENTILRAYEEVQRSDACVVGMPVKDTIKIADENGYVADTPDRSRLWQVQTPQVFSAAVIKKAYKKLIHAQTIQATDDAMVVEAMLEHPVKLVRGTYENIKITTPEDLDTGEVFAEKFWKNRN